MDQYPTKLGAGLKIAGAWALTRTGKAVLLLLVASAFVLAVLSYSGFCFEKRQFLQDEEYIDAVVEEIIRQPNYTRAIPNAESIQLKTSKVVPYRDKTEFRSANPYCCAMVPAVGDRGPDVTFWDRVTGRAARLVSVKYQVNYVDDDQTQKSNTAVVIYAVTNCGRAWNARN